MFSRRTSWQRRRNRLAEVEAEVRARRLPILDLTQSNPTRAELALPREVRKAILGAIADPVVLAYEPTPCGLQTARDAISSYYAGRGIDMPAERILLTASTSEAYACLFKLLCDAGDRVLAPSPSYPLFEYLTGLEGVMVDSYPLHYDDRFFIDFPALEKKVTERTRAVIAVNPNNPTGSYLKSSEVARLTALCARRRLAILSDEVFSDYLRAPEAGIVTSLAGRESTALTFTLSGLSKLCGLPQLKLGWMTLDGPAEIVAEALARLEIVLDTYLSVGAPVQHAVPELLAMRPTLHGAIAARVAEGESIVKEMFPQSGLVRALHAEGGWYQVLRLPATRSEEQWVVALLEEDGVLVHPGFFFNFPDAPYAVVSLLTPPDALREGLARLARRASARRIVRGRIRYPGPARQ